MTMSVEQRTRALKDGDFSPGALKKEWVVETRAYRNDIDAAAAKKVANLIDAYESALIKFAGGVTNSDKVNSLIAESMSALWKLDDQMRDMVKLLRDLVGDTEKAGFQMGTTGQETVDRWADRVKFMEGISKDVKAACDKLNNLNESYDKAAADTLKKAKAQCDAATAALGKFNKELNDLESQIRREVANCESIAIKQGKTQAVKALRGIQSSIGR